MGVGAVVVVLGLWHFAGDDTLGTATGPVAIPTSTIEPAPSTPLTSQDRWPVQQFDGDTRTVLLFDDGRDGAVAVDLDTGETAAVNLPGQRSGDQLFRLHRMGSWIIVGWDEVFAVPVGRDRTTRQLGDGAVFLPHAEPDSLWLIDQPSEATTGPSTWTLVDIAGQVLTEVEGMQELEPLRGVPRGLALRRSDGSLARYDLASQQVVGYLGVAARWIADVSRDRVLWCDEACDQLRVANADGATVATIGSEDETFDPNSAWLSGDGSRLGAVVTVEVGEAVDRRVRVYDVETEVEIADAQLRLGHAYGNWTLDGEQFFYWLNAGVAGQGAPLEVGRWRAGSQIEQVDVAPRGTDLQGFVALPRQTVTALFTQDPPDTGEAGSWN